MLIDPRVDNDIRVELGAGDDYAQAGSGNTRLYGGAGNDRLKLGSGDGIAMGDDGDDLLIAGSGNGILKGNNGNDRMQAGQGFPERRLYMDGGDGHDFMIVTRNDTHIPAVMHGGKGENLIVTHGPATVLPGATRTLSGPTTMTPSFTPSLRTRFIAPQAPHSSTHNPVRRVKVAMSSKALPSSSNR